MSDIQDNAAPDAPAEVPLSVLQRRWRKFKTLKRGWYSFQLLVFLYLGSFLLPFLVSSDAICVRYEGEWHFPVFGGFHQARDFGQDQIGEVDWRELQEQYYFEGGKNYVMLPPYPYNPLENLLHESNLAGQPPHAPNAYHILGTDDRGRDVFVRLVYGFRTSITFALGVIIISYLIGMTVGACFGYFSGRLDFWGQRLVEIWSGLPFLYTIIIISSIVKPGMWLLILLLALFRWVGISFYMRGEFYREKSKDYVAAAIAQGESHRSIMFRHILPNGLTPIISFAPFAVVVTISSLVSLDYLGFGLPAPTPSWGELVNQGLENITAWHLVFFPLGAMFFTLLLVVFIGEAVREAFDPKVFSRLR